MDAPRQKRRIVTLLFADLCDSTGIAAGLEPEQFAHLLEQIRMIAHRVIPAHGGEIIRVDGDGMLCIFGYPQTFENAGRRATEAALDMHAAVTALDVAFAPPDRPLRLHSGIHAGMVLLRGGDIICGKYEVLGDATTVAARLCDAAGAGEILVGDDTLGGERHFFRTGTNRAIRLAGRKGLLGSWPVIGRSNVASRFESRERARLTPVQGRDAERMIFLDWLNAGSAPGTVMLIHGPAGIGKSRFARQMSEEAAALGWRVTHGYCESYLSARPLQPFHQIAEALAGPSPAEGQLDIAALNTRLGSLGKVVLKLSADIGHMVPVWLIEALLGQSLDQPVLARLEAADFLFAGETVDTYRFKHGLTRDALYASIGLVERKSLHGNVLAALEDAIANRGKQTLLDGLAYHAVASGDVGKGLPYAIAAGDAALAASAPDRAQAHYRSAIDIIPLLADSEAMRAAGWSLLNKFGLACIVDPAAEQLPVLKQVEAILRAHGTERDAMRSAYWLGSIAYGLGLCAGRCPVSERGGDPGGSG